MRMLTLALVLALQAQASAKPSPPPKPPQQRFDFDDDEVDGRALTPDDVFTTSPLPAKSASLIRLRDNFIPELVKSADAI